MPSSWASCSRRSRGPTPPHRFPAARSSIASARASPTSGRSRCGRCSRCCRDSRPDLSSLLTFRLGLGIAEAPCFPTNSRVLSTWFPQHERARATGRLFDRSVLRPRLPEPPAVLDRRDAGLARAVHHRRRRRPPVLRRSGCASIAIRRTARASTRRSSTTSKRAAASAIADAADSVRLAQHRQAAASIARSSAHRSVSSPATRRSCSFSPGFRPTSRPSGRWSGCKVGFYAVMPFIAASVGVLVGGWVSDMLIKRTGSATLGRKLPILTGLLLASTIVIANFVDSNEVVIAIMSIAFFGQGMVNLGWTLITDVAPKNLIGLTGGVFNLCANLAGIVTPLVIGVDRRLDRLVLRRARLHRRHRGHRRALVHLHRRRRAPRRSRRSGVAAPLAPAFLSPEAIAGPRTRRPRLAGSTSRRSPSASCRTRSPGPRPRTRAAARAGDRTLEMAAPRCRDFRSTRMRRSRPT